MQRGSRMNFVDSPAVRMLDLIEGVFSRAPDGYHQDYLMSLETLVHLATFSETSDDRDTIYTLLNLAKDRGSLARYIEPDYPKNVVAVYADFVRYCHSLNQSLDILCRPWAPKPSNQARPDILGTQDPIVLPSWIAPREKLPYGEPSWHWKHRLHGNPLVGGGSKRIYNAHDGKTPVVVEGPDGSRPDVMTVKGVRIAQVTQISWRMANAIITQECLFLLGNPLDTSGTAIEAWWRTLCANRDEHGNPAPAEWQKALEHVMDMLNGDAISSIDIEQVLDEEIAQNVRTIHIGVLLVTHTSTEL
ncbi:hypothetical protein ACEQ8H_002009 [Pleosporales sp. CAS-2024a]